LPWFVVSFECFSGKGGSEDRKWCPLKFCLTWEFNSEKSRNRLRNKWRWKRKYISKSQWISYREEKNAESRGIDKEKKEKKRKYGDITRRKIFQKW
jgi:hypothetical protein